MMEFVPERLKGEVARFDITDGSGKVIVEKDKRITAKHLRDLAAGGIQRISVPEDFLLGRVLAKNIVDADTGEIIAKANDELTESVLGALRAANVHDIQTLYTNDLDRGPYISQTLRIDETTDQLAARGRDLPHDASWRAADRGSGWKPCSSTCSSAKTATTCRASAA